MPDYDESFELFLEWTEGESLRKHAYSVESGMEYYAKHYDEDVELWKMTGLLHDMDYEKHPSKEEHPFIGVELMRGLGYPEEMLQAILGHADYSGVPRDSLLAKTLFAVDELCGFTMAVAYMRPTKLEGMSPKSITKKLKDRRFAAAINRDDIRLGAEELGLELNDHIANVIAAMQLKSERLGF